MKQIMGFLLGFLFLGVSLGSVGDVNKDDLARLQGKWKIVTYIVDGKPSEVENIWQITGNKILYLPDSSIYSVIKLDATKKPKVIEFDTITKDPAKIEKGFNGIYEFDRETLKFCAAKPGKEPPTTFESKTGSGHVLTILKRVKDKE